MAAKILVVEDDAEIRQELVDLLHDEGYLVETAGDGAQALDRLRASDLPCVIVLDLMMPVMDGWTFRAELLNDPVLARVPVLIISGDDDAARHVAGLAATGFLAKPFDSEHLLRFVEAHCCTN